MTSSSPASPARLPDKPGIVVIIVAVVAAALTLAGVIALGWVTSENQRTAMGARSVPPYAKVDEGWTEGATQVWSAQIPADAEILVAGSYVVAVQRDGVVDASVDLTAYKVDESGASQAWTATVDLTSGTVGQAPFQVWDSSTLVHGNTLVDLATGTVSSASWSARDRPIVLEDRVITCSNSESCYGWEHGSTVPLWTADISSGHSEVEEETLPQSVLYRKGARYAFVGDHAVVNIDTGEAIPFTMPALQSWTISPVADGWEIVSWDSNQTNWHVYAYKVEGGDTTDDYAATPPWTGDEVPLYATYPRTRQQFKEMWTGNSRTGIIGWAHPGSNDTCYERIELLDGTTFEIPTITTGGSADVITRTNTSCAVWVQTSLDHRVMTVHLQSRLTDNAFAFMYNTSTGEAISFEGTDVMVGDQLSLVTERFAVGYDVDAGTLYGYTPAD